MAIAETQIDWNDVFNAALGMKDSTDPVEQMYAKAVLRMVEKLIVPNVFERLMRDVVTRGQGSVKVGTP